MRSEDLELANVKALSSPVYHPNTVSAGTSTSTSKSKSNQRLMRGGLRVFFSILVVSYFMWGAA